MSKYTNVSARIFRRRLKAAGFTFSRRRGSHETWIAPDGRPFTCSLHDGFDVDKAAQHDFLKLTRESGGQRAITIGRRAYEAFRTGRYTWRALPEVLGAQLSHVTLFLKAKGSTRARRGRFGERTWSYTCG